MGKELVIKDIAFDSIINEVRTGKADIGAAGISYSDERAKKVDFSINYSVSKQVVIVKNDSFINSIKDINDKKMQYNLVVLQILMLRKIIKMLRLLDKRNIWPLLKI